MTTLFGEQFSRRVLASVVPIIANTAIRDHSAKERFKRFIEDRSSTDLSSQPQRLKPLEVFYLEVFQGWLEIFNTHRSLQLGVRFIRRASRAPKKDFRELKYIVEKHLEDIYILSCRLDSLLSKVLRRLKRNGAAPQFELVTVANTKAKTLLSGIIRTRGHHVHEARFDDDDISRAEMYELVMRAGRMRKLRVAKKWAMVKAFEKWKGNLASNVNAIRKVLDDLLEGIVGAVFEHAAPR